MVGDAVGVCSNVGVEFGVKEGCIQTPYAQLAIRLEEMANAFPLVRGKGVKLGKQVGLASCQYLFHLKGC